MIQKEKVRDWRGRIIGFINTDTVTGNKTVTDFYGRIVGRYVKRLNVTQDFYGRQVAKGDHCAILLTTSSR